MLTHAPPAGRAEDHRDEKRPFALHLAWTLQEPAAKSQVECKRLPWDLGIAAVALFAGHSLLGNGTFGRVVAYLWAGLVIVNSFLIMGIAPWFAFTMIALAVLVVYGLASSPREASA